MGGDDRLDKQLYTIELRPFHPGDLDGLLRAWEAASRFAHPFMSRQFIAEQRVAVAKKYLPSADTDVAIVDGELAGFISMRGNEVAAIFVDPAYHGRGVGRALMDIPAAIHETMEVDVFEKNVTGLPFYERYGFKEVSRHIYEPLNEVVIRMRYQGRG